MAHYETFAQAVAACFGHADDETLKLNFPAIRVPAKQWTNFTNILSMNLRKGGGKCKWSASEEGFFNITLYTFALEGKVGDIRNILAAISPFAKM